MGFNNKGVEHLITKLKKVSDIPMGLADNKNADALNHLAQEDYLSCLKKVFSMLIIFY